MESDDDDFELFVSAESNSSPIGGRRLKRLKKAVDVAVNSPNLSDAGHDFFVESEGRSMDRQSGSDQEPDDEDEDSGFQQESTVYDGEDLGFEGGDESGVGVKRALEFDSSDEEEIEGRRDSEGYDEGNEGAVGIGDDGGTVGVGDVGGDGEKVEKKKKKKKERKKSRVERTGEFDVGNQDSDSVEGDTHVVTKRVSEKVRRNQLTQLRADSQRLLRESSDAGFKPVPLVHKPISSVLEKIRQRKLELAKKTVPAKKSSFIFPFPDLIRDDVGLIVDTKEFGTKVEGRAVKLVTGNSFAKPIDSEIQVNTLHVDGTNDASTKINHVEVPPQAEGIKPSYTSPVDDTQDPLSDSESYHTEDDHAENPRRVTEEIFAPSLLAMNLKLDCSSSQYESSDEDDHDKENIDPLLHQSDDFSIASLGDPVKNLIDVEAEEEDDSDNDMIRFQENEEEDSDDLEELNDMIAADYKEGDVDREKRNELHQKWLAQQDAARTENLLERLNCGPNKKTAGLVDLMDDKEDESQNEDEIEELSEDDLAPGNVARINFRKVQQMIPQMFTDNEDAYVSSEDEEFEKRLAKQNLLLKTEFQGSLVSPAEDENSREVFRLIKKLNIVPHSKKRAKSSVLHDHSLFGGRPNDLLKPSFLGRGSTSMPSKNQKTSAFKGFIFGRDDSNSKSSISISEDSDIIEPEAKPTRTSSSAKLRSSQSRHSSQAMTDASTVSASSTTSLYDILRRSSMQSDQCTLSAAVAVDQPKSIFSAFRVGCKVHTGKGSNTRNH